MADLLVAQRAEPAGPRGRVGLDPRPDRLDHEDVGEPRDHRLAAGAQLLRLGGYQGREAIELAFIAALPRLPPRQAVTLLLRDVLGYTGAEVATMLETSQTAAKGALQRARASLEQHLTDVRGLGRAPTPGSPQESELARRFADAFTADDITARVTAAVVPTRANTQPAFGCFLVGGDGAEHPAGLILLTPAKTASAPSHASSTRPM